MNFVRQKFTVLFVTAPEMPPVARGQLVLVFQSSERDQIAFFKSLICTGGRRNPAACGTHKGNRERRFATPLRAGGHRALEGRRARISAAKTFVSRDSGLESKKQEEERSAAHRDKRPEWNVSKQK